MKSSKAATESELTRALCAFWNECGIMSYPLIGGREAPVGWPDRYVHSKLWRGFLEFKATKGKLQPAQRQRILTLNRIQQGSAFVVRYHSADCAVTPLVVYGDIEDADGNILGGFNTPLSLIGRLVELTKC